MEFTVAFRGKTEYFYLSTATRRSTTLQQERIFGFPWLQWLRENATVLRCMYIASPILFTFVRVSVS